MRDEMRFASALSTERDARRAVDDVVNQLAQSLEHGRVDLLMVFLSEEFLFAAGWIAGQLRLALQPGALVGCAAAGVIAGAREVEQGPAMAVLAARLPNVRITPFVVSARGSAEWESLLQSSQYLRSATGFSTAKAVVLMADPFSTPMQDLLAAFDDAYAGVPIIGGMASAAQRAGGNALMLDERVTNYGLVGVALDGDLDVDIVMSQGCRPVGRAMVVSEADDNVILALDNDQALAEIQNVVSELSDEDREMMQNGLFIGRAIHCDSDSQSGGDYLIRDVTGADPDNGSVTIGDLIEAGERVQLHVRDAATARDDMELALAPQALYGAAGAALVFACRSRGSHLFAEGDTHVRAVHDVLGPVPTAGFFCAGEIGPLAGRTFLHTQAAGVAVLRPAARGA